MSPVVKHYNYDGVGRIYRTTSPIDAASLPESYIFNSGATAFTRSERFFYDGTRRIQEVVTDPVIVHEEGDVPTIGQQILTPPPQGVGEFTRLKTQYVWGPGDSPTSGALELLRVTEITKNASGATVEYPRLVPYDAQGDVAALVQPPGVGGTAAAAVTAQWTWSPYGEVLTYEEFYPHQPLNVGHKGLFVDRLNAGPLVFDMYTWTAAEPARLQPGATLIGHTTNRTYSPGLGRWLQQDPNGAGASTVGDSRYHGEAPDAISILVDANRRAGDGLNLFGYLGQNPLSRSDPMGLSWDPFDDMLDDFVATNAAQQAAFMERLRGGFNSGLHIAWQVAQLHPAVGMAVAGYNLATGNFSAWDLLAIVPGGAQAKALAKAGVMLGKVRGAYEAAAVAGLVAKGAARVGKAASKLPDAFHSGPKNTWVYLGWKEGVPVYVGITNDVERRRNEHRHRFRVIALPGGPYTRLQALSIETAIYLTMKATGQFENKISPMSAGREYYADALEWASQNMPSLPW